MNGWPVKCISFTMLFINQNHHSIFTAFLSDFVGNMRMCTSYVQLTHRHLFRNQGIPYLVLPWLLLNRKRQRRNWTPIAYIIKLTLLTLVYLENSPETTAQLKVWKLSSAHKTCWLRKVSEAEEKKVGHVGLIQTAFFSTGLDVLSSPELFTAIQFERDKFGALALQHLTLFEQEYIHSVFALTRIYRNPCLITAVLAVLQLTFHTIPLPTMLLLTDIS